ncbi:MAG: proton-conducting transporter membrane subunit [Candidatus Udaeobacter sp.]
MNLPQTERLIFVIALLTLIYGNLAALPQTNLKRLLAYSSIAHAGYLLIGVVCFDVRAIIFYLVAYLLMTLLSFAVLIIVAQKTGEEISDFDGLAKRSPFLAFAMLIGMVSLAGLLCDDYQHCKAQQGHQQIGYEIEDNRPDIETDYADEQITRMRNARVRKQSFQIGLR